MSGYKMALSRSTVMLGLFAASSVVAQTTGKPIITDSPPFLCVGGDFVAMARTGNHGPLIIVPIDLNGIEPPQTISLAGDAVFGMQCNFSRIELLVQDYKSNGFMTPLYKAEWRAGKPITISEEHREGSNTPKSHLTPENSFEWGANRTGLTKGDWRVLLAGVADRLPNYRYEVHFVSKQILYPRGGATDVLVIDLLEKTFDGKVTKSVPLVKIEASHD